MSVSRSEASVTSPEPVVVPPPEPELLSRRIVRGIVGGLVAGAVFAALTIWFTTQLGDAADQPLLMISTIATGAESVDSGNTNMVLGLLVHLVLSGLFGLGFVALTPRLGTNGSLLLVGAAYGMGVYVVNFRILSPFVFPAFQEASQPFELLIHLLYGLLLAVPFISTGVRGDERPFVWVAAR